MIYTLKGGTHGWKSVKSVTAHELEFLYEAVLAMAVCAPVKSCSVAQACHDSLAEMLEAVRGKHSAEW